MKISIIIPVYNATLTLKECLDAVFNISYKNFEVILVSDGSTDNTLEIAKKYECKIIELPQNNGAAFSRNEGSKKASGDILFFVDADVILKKNSLDILNNKFSDKNIWAIQGIYSHEPMYESIFTQYQQSYMSFFTWSKNLTYAPFVVSACFAIRRELFIQSKGFNSNIKSATCEDEEFGMKLINEGYKINIVRELNVEHRVHYTFKHFINRNINRYTSHMKSYFRNRSFAKKIKQSNYFKILLRLPILALILLILTLNIFFDIKINLSLFTILNLIFLILHFEFIKFVMLSRGMMKAFVITIICYLDAFLMLIGIFYGSLSYYVFGLKY